MDAAEGLHRKVEDQFEMRDEPGYRFTLKRRYESLFLSDSHSNTSEGYTDRVAQDTDLSLRHREGTECWGVHEQSMEIDHSRIFVRKEKTVHMNACAAIKIADPSNAGNALLQICYMFLHTR